MEIIDNSVPINTPYPRVLVVAMGRINARDSDNNGLLLRNLFGGWPRENLAQIYSSGDTGDDGFFGNYYKLGSQDRRLGRLFYQLKTETLSAVAKMKQPQNKTQVQTLASSSWIRRLMVDTGLYELIFSPRISRQMQEWVQEFCPDIVFSQGYSLTFAWLPVMLKKSINTRLAFFCSDDWPTYMYSGLFGEPRFFRWLVRPIVRKAVSRLLDSTDVPLAFGQPMAEEYEARYRKKFTVLTHADDPHRFETCLPIRIHPADTLTIMAVGTFNRYRWPLLLDANESCRLLEARGINVRIAVLSSVIDPLGINQLAKASFIDIQEDPGNDKLPCYLKGADLLFLVEGFDKGFVSTIHLSISSKAHLFMFSQRPILVYAHSDTGIAKYAKAFNWARVVSRRDILLLTETIRGLLTNDNEAKELISQAHETARLFHSHKANRSRLFGALTGDTHSTE